jgi:hypothetical protein
MLPFIFWIKMKDLKTLDTWNLKQLRNLRINLNNRIQTFQNSPKAKELQASHVLLEEVKRTEKKLTRE